MDSALITAEARLRGIDGDDRAASSYYFMFLASAFLFFVTDQLLGVAAAAAVVLLFCFLALAAHHVTVSPAFPFLHLSRGTGAISLGGGGGGGTGSAPAGMNAAAISELPAAFGFKRDHAAAGWAQCAICIGLVHVGEAVRRLPSCGHLFHAACVDVWLGAHATCPLCRAAVCALPV